MCLLVLLCDGQRCIQAMELMWKTRKLKITICN